MKIWELLLKAVAPSIIDWLKGILTGWISKGLKVFRHKAIKKHTQAEARDVNEITKKIYALEARIELEEMTVEQHDLIVKEIVELENELRRATRELNNTDDL